MVGQRTEPDVVTAEEVLKRSPMLSRISRDVIHCYERRQKLKERLEEFVVISRKFNSPEIQETIQSLRKKVENDDSEMGELEKEVRLLGGVLRIPARASFTSTQSSKITVFTSSGILQIQTWFTGTS